MTTIHIIEAVVGAGLIGLLGWRGYTLFTKFGGKLGITGQALLGGLGQTTLANQPANLPWVPRLTGTLGPQPADASTMSAGDWYDPTTTTVKQTFNEYGFITSASPAPVNPKTGQVPLTNLDVCNWVGHSTGNPCSRCGTIP